VIGLGLDLTLRERSDGRITLDDFMRALWDKLRTARHENAGLRRDALHDE
jgi:predicted metalloprotease with PDZ domain